MDFGLTTEQKLLQETLRDFARRELLPNYASRDVDKDLPPALVKKLGEMGLLAPMVDTHLGGSKLDYVSYPFKFRSTSHFAESPNFIMWWQMSNENA